MNFPKNILDSIQILRQIFADGSSKRNFIDISYPVVEIFKVFKEKELSIKLIYDSKGKTFELQFPTYQYTSKISHFDYNKSESRWTRDKDFLFSLIRNLKACGFWDQISNQDFLVVNSFNKRTNAKDLLKILKEVKAL